MLKNLTPHEVKIFKLNGVTPDLDVVIEAGEEVARVSCEYIKVDKKVDGIDLYRTVFGEVTGLPAYEEGVYLLVSTMVREALPLRSDLVSPGQLLRDDNGNVIGCLGLVGNFSN
nr:MAG TPA: hypothetical protein [Caudoviricetes sp.]